MRSLWLMKLPTALWAAAVLGFASHAMAAPDRALLMYKGADRDRKVLEAARQEGSV